MGKPDTKRVRDHLAKCESAEEDVVYITVEEGAARRENYLSAQKAARQEERTSRVAEGKASGKAKAKSKRKATGKANRKGSASKGTIDGDGKGT